MKYRTGLRGTCRTCDAEIYFSEARDPGDPWVHSDWAKRLLPGDNPNEPRHASKLPAYDHRADPVLQVQTFTVTVETPAKLMQVTRHDVAQALWDIELFHNVTVTGESE
jgi:hypothetical protein